MTYKIALESEAEDDCEYWERYNQRYFTKIRELLIDIKKHPFEGIGKPELLKHDLHGFWSRHINKKHRILYAVKGDLITIYRCRGHYI